VDEPDGGWKLGGNRDPEGGVGGLRGLRPPAPAYPAIQTEGTLVTQTGLAAYDDASMAAARDIYYYAAFSYDCAGNYSAGTTTSRDRSTSYWLGDISPTGSWDGLITLTDLSAFSLTFGKVDGGSGWNEEGDFGPTDDWGRFGIRCRTTWWTSRI